MQCDEFETRRNELLDLRASPEDDSLLAAHARSCEECAAVLLHSRRLFAGLRSLSLTPAPDDLAPRVLERYSAQVSRSWFDPRIVWLAPAILAASVLCVVALRTHAPPAGAPLNAGSLQAALPGKTPPQTAAEYDEYKRMLSELAVRVNQTPQFEGVNRTLSPSMRPIGSSFGLAIDALRRTIPHSKETRSEKRPQEQGAMFPDSPFAQIVRTYV